jgi:hypothetical protein
MELYRQAIDADPAAFERLIKKLEKAGEYRLWGEPYKRPKADRGERLDPWYNRRSVSVGYERTFGGDLFSPVLPDLVVEGYARLMPVYRFLREVYRAFKAEQTAEEHATVYGFEI